MKGTEKIIAHIADEAKAQADGIVSQAESKCAEILAGYQKQADGIYENKMNAGKQAVQSESESVVRLAKMDAKKLALALKQEMVALSFDKAVEKLSQLPEAEYVAFLAKLAKEASVTKAEQVVLNAKDKAAIGDKLIAEANKLIEGGKLSLAEDTGDFSGGLILRRENIEVNCTTELLVDLKRQDMASQVAEVLFA